jgi:arylsulfatase
VGRLELPFVMTMISSTGPSVGRDHGSAVSELYEAPFPFAGTLDRVDVQLVRRTGPEDAAAREVAERSAMGLQ